MRGLEPEIPTRAVKQLSFGREEVDALMGHFQALTRSISLRPLRSPEHDDDAVAALNALIDAGAGDEAHPLAPLLDLVGALVVTDEDQNHPLAERFPVSSATFL